MTYTPLTPTEFAVRCFSDLTAMADAASRRLAEQAGPERAANAASFLPAVAYCADKARDACVLAAREQGATWVAIAKEMDLTRQAVSAAGARAESWLEFENRHRREAAERMPGEQPLPFDAQ